MRLTDILIDIARTLFGPPRLAPVGATRRRPKTHS